MSLGAAFWWGTDRASAPRGTNVVHPLAQEEGDLRNLGERSAAPLTLRERLKRKEVSQEELRMLIAETKGPNLRKTYLLAALETATGEEFADLYRQLEGFLDHERQLAMRAWMRADQAGALDFILEEDRDNLELALAEALAEDSGGAIAWSEHTNVFSLNILRFRDELPREEDVDASDIPLTEVSVAAVNQK